MMSIYEAKQIDEDLKVTRLPFGYFYTGIVPDWLLSMGKTSFKTEEDAKKHYERFKTRAHAPL